MYLWILLLIVKFIFFFTAIFLVPSPIKLLIGALSLLAITLEYRKFFLGSNTFFFENYDILRKILTMLTIWLIFLIVLCQKHVQYKNLIHLTVFRLIFRLLLTFTTSNLFIFYFFFEWSLIPIFLIIMGWGYQPERIKARLSLFFYTLFASLPLLLAILTIMSWRILPKIRFLLNITNRRFLSLITIFAFLVKFPMYGTHLWLPKAHVEAPVAGSIILAGVLLKLGGYGIIRIRRSFNLNWVWVQLFSLSLLGGGVLRILCLTQRDIKVVIAYSSVVHMALVIVGVLFITNWGLEGGLIIMVAHGVCSSGIFAAANIIYERRHSRRFYFNRGYLNRMPVFSTIWFILIVANFGGPFIYNLLGEIILIINVALIRNPALIILCLLSFFSAAYSIILYRSTNQGQIKVFMCQNKLFRLREALILFSHVWPLLFLCTFLRAFFF